MTNPPVNRRGGVFVSLPVLNEAENIVPLLDKSIASLGGQPYVVCVVDDGSRDGTIDLLRERGKKRPKPSRHLSN